MDANLLKQAAEKIRNANRVIAFTGAGISVESGVPPFRGEKGIWATHDPSCLDLKVLTQILKQRGMRFKLFFMTIFPLPRQTPRIGCWLRWSKQDICKE